MFADLIELSQKPSMSTLEIKQLRIDLGEGDKPMPLDAFAVLIGTTTSQVWRWEHEKTRPCRMAQRMLNLIRLRVDRALIAA